MAHLDLASVLNLVSTAAIVLIQTTQNRDWTDALTLTSTLPENATAEHIHQQGEAMVQALFELSIRLEPVGYMVFCDLITLKAVDDLIGGVVTVIWSRSKEWTSEYRKVTGNPKFNEWVEWLAERIVERRGGSPPRPASQQYRAWREH